MFVEQMKIYVFIWKKNGSILSYNPLRKNRCYLCFPAQRGTKTYNDNLQKKAVYVKNSNFLPFSTLAFNYFRNVFLLPCS